MIVNAISQLGARLLDTNRTWETAGASRARKFMSIRATHRAAYGEEDEFDDASSSAPERAIVPADDPQAESIEATPYVFTPVAPGCVTRQVRTLAEAEDAYASN